MVLLLAIALPLLAGGKTKCSYCGTTTAGKYYRFETAGKTVLICEKCRRTGPKCTLCEIPLRRPKGWDGREKLYCPKCFKDRKICSICGKTINGKYFSSSAAKQFYCEKCHEEAPRCASCKRPIKKETWVDIHGKKICPHCSKNLIKCSLCNLPIAGARMSYPFADGVFCEHCVDNQPHCYVCGVPVGEDFIELSDDRTMCPTCGQTAILTRGPMRMIDNAVRRFLKKKLNMEIYHDYRLKLVISRARLGTAADVDIVGKEQGMFTSVDGEFTIFILEGVTEEMCYETLAHECAHAWHAEHGMENADLEIREGFAQWVASKALEYFDYENGLQRLQSRTDPNYGIGYQKFAAVEEENGVDGVFEFLAENSRRQRR